jgi:hypothetical protein
MPTLEQNLICAQEWGWVMEMYAFTLALHNSRIGPVDLHLWDYTFNCMQFKCASYHMYISCRRHRVTRLTKQNLLSVQEWGWVMEMYAFTLALYNSRIGPVDLHLELAAQPPWDTHLELRGDRYKILHYTYPCDYALSGAATPGVKGEWQFNKRDFSSRPPPRQLPMPPVGMENDLGRTLINAIDEATDAIPGWNEYHFTGRALELMKYED